ncbi:MAG: hypothetical protein HS113_00175 [Verrucomicrobiales bacterium]|nr:hypothetical protein [Verrucomicrobiales bacterium]
MTRSGAVGLGLVLWLGAGCAENAAWRRSLATPYQPANVHRQASTLPVSLRRVALLPVTAAEDITAQSGVRTLEPVLVAEVRKQGLFEVVPVSRAELREWTGRERWRREEPLPADLLATVREQTGCDAVLFSELSVYQPYPPLMVGWHLSLVEVWTHAAYWSVDEVFDAGSPEVIAAAQAYYRGGLNQPSVQLDSSAILNSPRRFGQYSAAAAVGTLPRRGAPAKAATDSGDK